MFLKKNSACGIITLIVLLVSGCSEKADTVDDALSLLDTQVHYIEKITLPDGARLQVRLEDVSEMDVAAELVSSATRKISSVPPYSLQIAFPTKQIKMNRRYNLHASILLEDKLLFISTTQINPFEVGIASPIQIKVDLVSM